jgi:hypothetical protein
METAIPTASPSIFIIEKTLFFDWFLSANVKLCLNIYQDYVEFEDINN